jgi:hypothetical protein
VIFVTRITQVKFLSVKAKNIKNLGQNCPATITFETHYFLALVLTLIGLLPDPG